jgi:hypothetical protein
MNEVNRHVILDVPYQGKAWWAFVGVFSIVLLFRVLLGFRRKRHAGQPVDVRKIIAACIVFLVFFADAIFQLLSHR